MRALADQELVRGMLDEACEFIEFYDSTQMGYMRYYGYSGPNPHKFHPSSGDKLILRKYMEKWAKKVPENYRCRDNCKTHALMVLFLWYYPDYDDFNRRIQE